MSKVVAILALGPDNVIGKGNKLAWNSKKDFEWFKSITNHYPCIFGDVTFFNLPKYPLKNRLNIVCNPEFTNNIEIGSEGGYIKANTIENGIKFASNYDKIYICGGKGVYKYCFENNLIDEVLLTLVEGEQLSIDITKNPEEYVRFPFDLKTYLATDWEGHDVDLSEFKFSQKALEQTEIDVKFIHWVKK